MVGVSWARAALRGMGVGFCGVVISATGCSGTPIDAADHGDAASDAGAFGLDASEATAAADADTCESPTTQCGSTCIDLRFDPSHCGDCNTVCPAGEVCSRGACGLTCSGGSTLCGDRCVDTLHDPANCGGCGTACSSDKVCSNGACSLTCLGGSTQCGDLCVDLRDDPTNCGGCGYKCGPLVACVNSICTPLGTADAGPACPTAPYVTPCGGSCVDTTTDHANCGTCFHSCAVDQSCVASACECPGSESFCSSKCTDTMTDSANCGACGAACMTHEVCSGGGCVCAPGSESCSGVCKDTGIDMAHCGACGAPCAIGNVCTNGICAAPTSSWKTFGADGQHSGKNPDELGVPPMIDSWSTHISPTATTLSPAVVDNGVAYVSYGGGFGPTSPLVAVNVADGSPVWTYNFGAVDSVGQPTVTDGVVYIQTNHGTSGDSFLWSIDAASGSVNWAAPFGSQWERFWAPLVVGTSVYVDGGTYGGLYGFSTVDGTQLFFNSGLDQYDSWSPAYFGGYVFSFMNGHFREHDPATGTTLWTVTVTTNWSGYSVNSAPAFGDAYAYVISPPNLIAIDPSTQAVVWTANGTYSGTAAVADGVVYGISAGNLVARNAATGSLMWTFVGDQLLTYPPVVANGYVYVASASNTYAVHSSTHASTWTTNAGGWLSIASGRLLVAGTDGQLRGFVLTQ